MSDEKLALEWMRQQAYKIDPYIESPSFEECVELIGPAFKKGKHVAQLRSLLAQADRRAGAAERKHAALKFAKEKSLRRVRFYVCKANCSELNWHLSWQPVTTI